MKEREMEKNQQLERLEKQIRFIVEIDKVKNIFRQTYLADAGRKENDAEHSWHIALMAYLLQEYAEKPVDVSKVMLMVLIHDLVEIDAGDTYAYDEEAKKDQQEREQKAADRIFAILPEDQAEKLRALWDEFEEGQTKEARFARTMDNFQPVLLNASSGGKAWQERGVRLEQVLGRNQNTAKGSEMLWQYVLENFIMPNVEKGKLQR